MFVEHLVLGLLVSTAFFEVAGFHPGGIVVPGYFALYLDQPWRLVGTAGVALLAWGLYRVLAGQLVLFGRRRFVLMLLAGAMLAAASYRLAPRLWPAAPELRAIGYVIPGLVANAFERQGVGLTVVGIVIATTATYFLVRVLLPWG